MSFRSYYCCDRRYLGHDCNCPSPTQYGEALCRMLTDDGVLTAQESPPTDRDLLQRAAVALRKTERGYLSNGDLCCPVCGLTASKGHDADCDVGAILSAIEARLKETA